MFVLDSMIVELQAGLAPLRDGLRQASGELRGWAARARESMQPFEETAAGMAAAFAGIVAPLALATRTAANFKEVLNEIEGLGTTSEDLERIRVAAIQMGPSAGGPIRAAEGLKELGKAGMSADEQIAALPGTILLSRAATIGLSEAAETSSGILRGFRMAMSQAGDVADQLAQAANSSAVDISHLQLSFKYIAPVAASSNQSLSQMSGILAALGNQMIRGEQAGTTIRSVLVALQKPSNDAAKVMNELGISIQDTEGRMLPLSDIIDQLSEKTANMTEVQRSAAVATIFGQEAISGVLALMGLAPGELEKYIRAQERATGAAQRMADAMKKGPNYEWGQFIAAAQTAGEKIGKVLMPAVESAIRSMKDLMIAVSGLPAEVQALAVAVAALAAALTGLAAVIGVVSKALPTLALGFANLKTMVLAARTALVSFYIFMGGFVGAAFWAALVLEIGLIVHAFNEWKSAIDDTQERLNTFLSASQKVTTDGGAAWRKHSQGIKLTADEARAATLYLRQLQNQAAEAGNSTLAARRKAQAEEMQKLYDKLKNEKPQRGGVVSDPTADTGQKPPTALELARLKNQAGALSDADFLKVMQAEQKKLNQNTREYWQLQTEINATQAKIAQDTKNRTRGIVDNARAELDAKLAIAEAEEDKGERLELQRKAYNDFLAVLKAHGGTAQQIADVERTIAGLKRQQADEQQRQAEQAERAAKALADANKKAFETLRAFSQGFAKAVDTSEIDDLTAKLAAQRDFVSRLEALGAPVEDIERAREDAGQTERDLNRAQANQSGKMPTFVAENFDTILNLPKLIGPAMEHLATAIPVMVEASTGVMDFLGGVWPAISGAFGQLGALFTSGGFLPALQGLAAGIIPAVSAGLSSLAAAIVPILPIVAAVVAVFALLQQIWVQNAGGIQEAVGNLMTSLQGIWDGVVAVVQPFVNFFGEVLGGLVNQLAGVFSIVGAALQGLGWILDKVLRPVLDPIAAVFRAINNAIIDLINWIRDFLKMELLKKPGEKADDAKKAAAADLPKYEIPKYEIPKMAAQIGTAVGRAVADVMGSFTSINPLPVEDMAKANVFGVGPSSRFFYEKEARVSIDLNVTGEADAASIARAFEDSGLRAMLADTVGGEVSVRSLNPRFS